MITFMRLQYVRSYEDGSFECNPGVNIIVGANASGKTTLIEGLLVGLQGKSFKGRDIELIQKNTEWARIDIGLSDATRVCKLVVQPDESVQKTFELDDRIFKRLSLARTVPVVLFEPNHLLLLHGSPEHRRSFLDDLIAQLLPGYDATRRQYKRVLTQRNTLLKRGVNPGSDELFVWNLRLSELGGKLVSERQLLLERFNNNCSRLYSVIAGQETEVRLQYETKLSLGQYETSFLRSLEQNLQLDLARGFTGTGPHRDDIAVFIGGKRASESASRGEIRTLLLALKMLEAEFIESARDQRPVLLFDDVFSELDGKRRHALVRFLEPYQTFITTTDADVVIEHFTESATIIALG
jgi:DNA replication and repair protein RecF